MCTIGMATGCLIYLPSFMTFGTWVQAVSKFCLKQLEDCNIGITDVKLIMYAVEKAS
jgi:hypothetical protein